MMTIEPKITTIDGTPVLVLSPEILTEMGIADGDTIDVTLIDKTLTIRASSEVERKQRIKKLSAEIIERRRSVYEALAKGVE